MFLETAFYRKKNIDVFSPGEKFPSMLQKVAKLDHKNCYRPQKIQFFPTLNCCKNLKKNLIEQKSNFQLKIFFFIFQNSFSFFYFIYLESSEPVIHTTYII